MKKASEKLDTTFRFTIVEEKGDEVIIEVSPEDYARQMAAGILPDETLPPGRHKGIRGGFLKRHPNFDPATVKTTIYIRLGLDQEVLEYYKQLAKQTGADSYEILINKFYMRRWRKVVKSLLTLRLMRKRLCSTIRGLSKPSPNE